MSDQGFPMTGQLLANAPNREQVQATVASIVARDPAFNLDAFLAEAQQAFWLVGQAYEHCKPELAQSVLSPTLAERATEAIEQASRDNRIRSPRDEDASTGQLVSIESDASRDTATVRFTSVWQARSPKAGKDERRVEHWCFQRLATAHTVLPTADERCHNCGASLTSSAGRCRYCGTLISADGGWDVIRIDDVGRQEAGEAMAAIREVMAGFAAAREAAASAPTQPAPAPARRRRHPVVTALRVLFFAVLATGALLLAAIGNGGKLHRTVAKVVPAIRYPILKGPADVTGRVSAQRVTLEQVVPALHVGGSCPKDALRTEWDFKGKLPDGSAFHLQFGLPPAAGGPGTYKPPALTMKANAENKSAFVSWTSSAATNAVLVVRGDGAGEIRFANLAGDQPAGTPPISGQLAWSCTLG
jgi:hypothetical protein